MSFRFSLFFENYDEPSLKQVELLHVNSGRVTVGNRGSWMLPGSNYTFKWSAAVRGLSVLIIGTKAKSLSNDPTGPYVLCGGRGSAAAALDYAISKGTSWLSAMFDEAKSQKLLYRKVFKRINSERKTGENVSIWLRHDILPPSSIYVYCNENLLSDVGELERLATRVIQPEDISDKESLNHRPLVELSILNCCDNQTVLKNSCEYNLSDYPHLNKSDINWLTQIIDQNILQSLQRLDVFNSSLMGSKLIRLLESYFSRTSERVQLRHYFRSLFDNTINKVSQCALLLNEVSNSIPKLSIATSPSHTASMALIQYLISQGLPWKVDFTSPNTLNLIARGALSRDALIVAMPTMKFFTESPILKEYIPVMSMPPISHSLVGNKKSCANLDTIKCSHFFLRGPDTCYVDALISGGILSRNKITISHANEIHEFVTNLIIDKEPQRAPLPFPYYKYFDRYYKLPVLDVPIETPHTDLTFLLLAKSFFHNRDVICALLRSAWLEVLGDDNLRHKIARAIAVDDRYLNLTMKIAGLGSFADSNCKKTANS